MANDCENKIAVSGSKKEIIKFKKAVKTKYKEDFHGWESIPQENAAKNYLLRYEVITKYSPGLVLDLAYFLSKQFPELQFKIEYSELMNAFEGTAYIKNGEISSCSGDIPGLLECQKYG
ncbi:MAG: hypothetical protein ACYDH1_19300 [Anaerolineaceae bacterium]